MLLQPTQLKPADKLTPMHKLAQQQSSSQVMSMTVDDSALCGQISESAPVLPKSPAGVPVCDNRSIIAFAAGSASDGKVMRTLRPDGVPATDAERTLASAAVCSQRDDRSAPSSMDAFAGVPAPPDELVMIAVPGEHSRKPQLAHLLKPYLPTNSKCLEVRGVLICCWEVNLQQYVLFETGFT